MLTDYLLESRIFPRTLHYCSICRNQTPHAIFGAADSGRMTCLRCAERDFRFELDRD